MFCIWLKSSVLESCSCCCCFEAAVDPICFHFSLAEFMPQVKVELVETVEGCTHEVIGHIFCKLFERILLLKKLISSFSHFVPDDDH